MVGAIVSPLPMCSQLRKCAAGDTVSSLTKLEKLDFELAFFGSIFRKQDQIIYKIEESGNLGKLRDFL